jgi:hypothetical protein
LPSCCVRRVARGCASTGLCLAMLLCIQCPCSYDGPQQRKLLTVVTVGKLWTLVFRTVRVLIFSNRKLQPVASRYSLMGE